MRFDDQQWAGLILLAAATQFAIVGMTVAEAVYPNPPGYSVSLNYISDLGVGPTANVFNGSIILLGVASIAASWLLFRAFRDYPVTIAVAVAGFAIIGVGVLTEDYGALHALMSFLTFLFAALAAILAFRILRPPHSYVSAALGVLSLVALTLYISKNYAGLGNGGMERMVVWPVLTWAIGFGGYLLGTSHSKESPAAS